jgi:hypothetical protein
MVVVMGTSLKVGGVIMQILNKVRKTVPQVLINLENVKPPSKVSDGFDVCLLGECDKIVRYLADRLNWITESAVNEVDEDVNAQSVDAVRGSSRIVNREKLKKQKVEEALKPVCVENSPRIYKIGITSSNNGESSSDFITGYVLFYYYINICLM